MTDQNVVVVRVRKSDVGKHIPFDKVYLFRAEDHAIIRLMFPFSFCFPVTEEFKTSLRGLKPEQTSYHTARRETSVVGKALELTANQNKEYWDLFFNTYDIDNRLVVIPVKTVHKGKKIFAAYFNSSRNFRNKNEGPQPTSKVKRRKAKLPRAAATQKAEDRYKLPSYAEPALFTPYPEPYNVIQPFCSICPNAMERIKGECVPGMPVCYTMLDISKAVPIKHEPANESE